VAAAYPRRSLVWRRRDLGSNDSKDAAAMQPAVVCCGHQRMARITSIAFDTTSPALVRNCTCICLAGRARSCSLYESLLQSQQVHVLTLLADDDDTF